jgi:hypothetical protein
VGRPPGWVSATGPVSLLLGLSRFGVLSDARSSLICAGWLPQDGLFDWNGHHCLQKANVASRGWLFIGFAWIPFLARGSGFNLAARTFVDDLVRGAAPEGWMAVRCAHGPRQVFVACR